MTDPDILKREIKILVFDQYGTVVDMQKGLTEIATPFLKDKGWDGNPHSFVTWWRRTHFENSMVMDRAGIDYTQAEVEWLVSEIEKLKPFPDVIEALGRLREAGYQLAILSNGDPDMLANAGPHIGFKFDHVISVAEAGYFKPHWATYATACEITGFDRTSCLFVANHEFDVVGAKSFGMRTAFIDRRKRPFGAWPDQPDLIVADFKELAETLI